MSEEPIGKTFCIVVISAALTAFALHLIPAIITSARVGTKSSLLFLIIFPVYAFFSGLWYCLLLSTIVVFTYQFSSSELRTKDAILWGFGLGIFYVIIKAIIPWFIK